MNSAIIINQSELKETLADLSLEITECVLDKIQQSRPPVRPVMTLNQLADYWQVKKQSIINWVKRDDCPLPVHYVGGDPRFHLVEVDSWSRMEAVRRGKRENVTETVQ